MKFSQRYGYSPASKAIQVESMDQDLRVSLWNVVYMVVFKNGELNYKDVDDDEYCTNVSTGIFHQILKRPLDTVPDHFYKVVDITKDHFNKVKWHEVYDLIEFFIDVIKKDSQRDFDSFITMINKNLERESAGYRIIKEEVRPITSPEEIQAIDEALSKTEKGTQTHLETSLRMLSDRTNPDYRNSIKESISAVEAHCKKIAGDQASTLGDALKVLERSVKLHPALKAAFSSLYGYTSDSNGIRHAIKDEPNISFAEAKFMLVACASFINYLIEKYPIP